MEYRISQKKKRSYYIPVVIGIMLLSFMPLFNRVMVYMALPTQYFLPNPEQPLIDELKKEEELFPTEQEPAPTIYSGRDHSIMVDNPDYEKIMNYNQTQREKRFEYRRSHPIEGNSSMLVSLMRHFAGQVTLFSLIVIFSIVHLLFSRSKKIEQNIS